MTCWLLPGSFTVRNCSSLYFSNAGASSFMILGVETVRALMSSRADESSEPAAMEEDWGGNYTCDDICQLKKTVSFRC